MNWHDVTGYAVTAATWLTKTLWDPDVHGFPNPDIARNIAFTLATFLLGWLTSLNTSKQRLKVRVINELILSQSELKARAWPKVWRMNDVREAWMLDPFVARLRFLYADMNERKSLNRKQLDLIENYIFRVEDFIERWEETQARRDGYRYAYDQTYHALRAAAKALGLQDNARFTGLGSPNDDLFGGQPPTAPAPAPAPQPPKPGLGWAPAE